MMYAYLGIDPGKNGAICCLLDNGSIAFKDYTEDVLELANWIKEIQALATIKICMIEDVHSIFGVSAKSNFNFGFNVGVLHGLIRGLGLPLDLVTPKKWQKDFSITSKGADIKKEVASIARRLYPSCDIYTPRGRLLDGRSDSLLIAHYCMKQYTGVLH